jgi:catechol 2,3-dioxygenase-like lactoylglutathione lyase family enzyme
MSVPASTFDHVGLSVADLDAATEFYGRAFGFASEFPFELTHAGVRGVMLLHGSGARLELFERPGAAPGIQGRDPIGALATRGYGHFALATPEIDALFAHAVAAGAREVAPPGPSPEPGIRFAFLADPEGNLIELVGRS